MKVSLYNSEFEMELIENDEKYYWNMVTYSYGDLIKSEIIICFNGSSRRIYWLGVLKHIKDNPIFKDCTVVTYYLVLDFIESDLELICRKMHTKQEPDGKIVVWFTPN